MKGEWNARFLDELEAFPEGSYSDQVDALSMGLNYLAPLACVPSIPPVPIQEDERLSETRQLFQDLYGAWRGGSPLRDL